MNKLLIALGALLLLTQMALADVYVAPEGDAAAGMSAPGDTAAADSGALTTADSYGFTPAEVSANQGAVAYWYAKAYASAFGDYPAKWADLEAKGWPLRKFFSPYTGDVINFDDGVLDFNGDMTYKVGSWDVEILVQTAEGVVTLPGVLPSAGLSECGGCCDITLCDFRCWKCCDDQDCTCTAANWLLKESMNLYVCRYGEHPCDDLVWMASGLAPIDRNYKEYAPFMDIEYVWKKCYLKSFKVHCCDPCPTRCDSGCKSCGKCNKGCKSCDPCACKSVSKSNCGGCKSGCNKCKSSCGGGCKSGCNKCR